MEEYEDEGEDPMVYPAHLIFESDLFSNLQTNPSNQQNHLNVEFPLDPNIHRWVPNNRDDNPIILQNIRIPYS